MVGDHFIYVVLCVDDMLLTRNNKEIIKDIKTQLFYEFDMKYLGSTKFILVMEIERDREYKKL
jgi:hypothetical protein